MFNVHVECGHERGRHVSPRAPETRLSRTCVMLAGESDPRRQTAPTALIGGGLLMPKVDRPGTEGCRGGTL